jgi:hypothetical protein
MADIEASRKGSNDNLTLGLGLGAVAFWLLGIFFAGENDEQGWIWYVMGALSLAATVTGFLSFRGGRPGGRAIAGLVPGVLLLLVFLAFVTGIVE